MNSPNITKLDPKEPFYFECHSKIKCFNECCQNLHQVLSPYDIIRLKHFLNDDSSIFLKTYTQSYIGPETGMPVVELKTKSQKDQHCIFVSPDGCQVYSDRPSTCRYYPLGRLVSRSRETGRKTESFVMIKESHCMGHASQCKQNIEQWQMTQELTMFDQCNDWMLELIAAKKQSGMRTLSGNQRYLLYMGCYDLDTFRQYAIDSDLKSAINTLPNSISGDVQLLEFSLKWLQQTIFGDQS